MNKIFNEITDKLLYSPMIGIYPSKVNLHTEYIKNIAKIFFKIMNESKIEYYVFAGSSIGLVRNGYSIPWVDDYDIIIFENDVNKFEKVINILKKNLFIVKTVEKSVPGLKPTKKINNNFKPIFNPLESISKAFAGYVIGSPRYNLNNNKTSFFQVDVFVSKIVNDKLKSIAGWGLYHRKDVPIKFVRPQNFKNFDDLNIPFFNKYENDVELEYGDVYQNSIIHISHGREKVIIPKKWQDVYSEFNFYEEIAINNTKKLFEFENVNLSKEENNFYKINTDNNAYDLFSIKNIINSGELLNFENNLNVKEILENKIKIEEELDTHGIEFHNDENEKILKSENLIIDPEKSILIDYLVDIDKKNYFELMKYISLYNNKVSDKTLHIFNSSNILYILDIKFYFKNMKINLHINDISTLENIRFFLDNVDIITVTDKSLLINSEDYLNNLVIINKPVIKLDIENSFGLITNEQINKENYMDNKKVLPNLKKPNVGKMINLKPLNKQNNNIDLNLNDPDNQNNIKNTKIKKINISKQKNIINKNFNLDTNTKIIDNRNDNSDLIINKNINNRITKINQKFGTIKTNKVKLVKLKN